MTSGSSLVFVILCISAAVANIHNDLIVAVGDKIELLANGSKSHEVELPQYNASLIVALAYDPSSEQLFFSDSRNKRGHIFSIGLNDTVSFGTVRDLVERGSNESVEALALDPTDNALLWTDGRKQSIRRVRLGNEESIGESKTVEVLHLLQGDKPRGLVSDPCTGMIYWTNWNIDRPTIERSSLNGSSREIVVQRDLIMPHGLGLDIERQTIYWANNLRFGSFVIERSRVDGSDRQRIYEGKGQFIFGLTVGDDYVYWTDWDHKTLFALPKNGSPDGPIALRKYQHKPMGVIVLERKPITCPAVQPDLHSEEPTVHQSNSRSKAVDDATTSTAAPASEPLCDGYCFNKGECRVEDSDISCICPPPFTGDQCELVERRDDENSTAELIGAGCSMPVSDVFSQNAFIAIVSLVVLSVLLMLAVVYLGVRVRQLSTTPRRKRRVLGKDKSVRSPDHVINIEDCCNMNICETPCTEPPSDTSRLISDKAKLLKCEF